MRNKAIAFLEVTDYPSQSTDMKKLLSSPESVLMTNRKLSEQSHNPNKFCSAVKVFLYALKS